MSRIRDQLPLVALPPAAKEKRAVPAHLAVLGDGRETATGTAAGRVPLWLCLWLPQLPLEVRGGGGIGEEPRVVVDHDGRVLRASEAAADAGIAPGLPLNAALALCPVLEARERDEAAERTALARLAAWAGAFTSIVSLEPPAGLLLEVRGSLRLFGGLEALRVRLRRALLATGHEGRDAVAPTPLAALWLARAGETAAVTRHAELAGRLGRLRPAVTGWPAATLALLRSLGVERLTDCMRLPRDGFTRRLGRAALTDLDRALGRRPDPRAAFRPPPRYEGVLELAAESADPQRLARAMAELFAELEGFLRARQQSVNRLEIGFRHLGHPATRLTLGLVRPGLEAAHFATLFAERLERLMLPAPVIGLSLEAEPTEPLDPERIGLFGDPSDALPGLRLVERLRARLGPAAVRGLDQRDEHRPEQAWRLAEPGSGMPGASPAAGPRPCWLLDPPRPLECRGGRPCLEGALRFESGPERLEAGWWDGGEIARDYWVARSPAGARLWVFRELQAAPRTRQDGAAWFLHGLFG
jgi:protein ImuB